MLTKLTKLFTFDRRNMVRKVGNQELQEYGVNRVLGLLATDR